MRLFVTFVLLSPLLAFAQVQRSFTVVATDSISAKAVKKLHYPRKLRDSLDELNTLRRIITQLQEEGYLLASFDSVRTGIDSVVAFLSSGVKCDDATIRLHDVPVHAAAHAGVRRKKNVNASNYLRIRKAIVTYYENNGYPFALVTLDSVEVLHRGVKGHCLVNVGNRVTIGKISIEGYKRIPPALIHQHIGVSVGDLYDEQCIRNIKHAIDELSFVETEKPPKVFFDKHNSAHVVISLRKRPSNRFDGIVGFSPDNNNKLVVTGKIMLDLNNILGQGENINIDWQKIDKLSQKLEASYSFRYILGSRLGNDFTVSLHKKDSTFINTDLLFSVPYNLAYNKLVNGFVQSKSSTIISRSLTSTQHSISSYGDVTKTMAGAGVKTWFYDYFLNPRRGYLFKAEAASGTRRVNNTMGDTLQLQQQGKTTSMELRVQLSTYLPLSRKFVVYIDNKTSVMQSRQILFNELFLIGGTKTLRGFDEGEIPCSRYTIATTEIRFLFQQNSSIYLFGNAAYYQNESVGMNVSDYPYGFGVGMNIQNKSSIFTISYAVGSQFGSSIKINNAKVHFGYINTF